MQIEDVEVAESRSYVIAEAGINHNGDFSLAKDLVDAATEAGADAIKFQSFVTEEIVTSSAPKAEYQETTRGTTQREMLESYELTPDQHWNLKTYCESRGITFLSTPFDQQSVDLLNNLEVPAFKVGSGDLTNYPLLSKIAALGRPMIVSTGMSTMDEVNDALEHIRSENPDVSVALLHCVSLYPTQIEQVNLRAMQTMLEQFDCPIGFSDHTTLVETPGIATAMGAMLVEKHLTLDRSLPGPDHDASLEPHEFARAVEIVRNVELARGSAEKQPVSGEEGTAYVARKSLHAATSIEIGEAFNENNVKISRPADGLEPRVFEMITGSRAAIPLDPDDPITTAHIEKDI